jgi:hypothetical protein
VDAGWFLDIPSYSHQPGAFTFGGLARSMSMRFNATYDHSCAQTWGGVEAWRCFHAQYAWSCLAVPTLFQEFLYDSANLGGGPFERAALQPKGFPTRGERLSYLKSHP